MLSRLYPNLELAQAKSSLRYRFPPPPAQDQEDNDSKVDDDSIGTAVIPENLASALPPLIGTSEEPTCIPVSATTTATATASHPRPIQRVRNRRPPVEVPDIPPSRGSRRDRHIPLSLGDSDVVPVTPSLAHKLDAINRILARAERSDQDGRTNGNDNDNGKLNDNHENQVAPVQVANIPLSEDSELLRRPLQSSHAERKVAFLLRQDLSTTSGSPGSRRRGKLSALKDVPHSLSFSETPSSNPHQLQRGGSPSKYLITAAPLQGEITPSHASPSKQLAPLAANATPSAAALMLDFVDAANNRPRPPRQQQQHASALSGSSSTASAPLLSLDKHLRRISLVSFNDTKPKGASSPPRPAQHQHQHQHRPHVFGVYSTREVMAVVRLFGFLDADGSGGVTIHELRAHEAYFQSLGYTSMEDVFHTLDANGDGLISLDELLRVCFRHATTRQLEGMRTLALVTSGPRHSLHDGTLSCSPTGHQDGQGPGLQQQQRRRELRAIFDVFDVNGDDRVQLRELVDVLGVDSSLVRQRQNRDAQNDGALTREDVQALFQASDDNHDNALDFDEFVSLLQSPLSFQTKQSAQHQRQRTPVKSRS